MSHSTLFAYTEPGGPFPAYVNMRTPESPDDPDAGTVTITVRGDYIPGTPGVPGQAAVPPRAPVVDAWGNVMDPGHSGFPFIAATPAVPPKAGPVQSVTVTTTEFFSGVLAAVAGIAPGGTFSHPSGVTMTRSVDGRTIRFTIGTATAEVPQDYVRLQGEVLREQDTLNAKIVAAATKGVVLNTQVVETVRATVLDSIAEARQNENAIGKGNADKAGNRRPN